MKQYLTKVHVIFLAPVFMINTISRVTFRVLDQTHLIVLDRTIMP